MTNNNADLSVSAFSTGILFSLFFLLTSSHVVGVGVGVGVVAVPEPAAVLAVAHVLLVAAFTLAVALALVEPLACRDFAKFVEVRHLLTAHAGAAFGAIVRVATRDAAAEPYYHVSAVG